MNKQKVKINEFAKELLDESQCLRGVHNYILDTFIGIENKQVGSDDMDPMTFNEIKDFAEYIKAICDHIIVVSE